MICHVGLASHWLDFFFLCNRSLTVHLSQVQKAKFQHISVLLVEMLHGKALAQAFLDNSNGSSWKGNFSKCRHNVAELGALCRGGTLTGKYRCRFGENGMLLGAASEAKSILWSSDARVSVFPSGECGGLNGFLQQRRNPGLGWDGYFGPVLHRSGLCFPCENCCSLLSLCLPRVRKLVGCPSRNSVCGLQLDGCSLLVRAAGFRVGCSAATSYEV